MGVGATDTGGVALGTGKWRLGLYRCPVRLRNSQAVSRIQRVLMTLGLRLIMNDGFSFDSSITCSEVPGFMGKSRINR